MYESKIQSIHQQSDELEVVVGCKKGYHWDDNGVGRLGR